MPGAEIQGTAFLNLLRQDWLSRFPPNTERILFVFFGVIFGAGLIYIRPSLAVPFALVCIVLIALGAYGIFVSKHIWIPWLIVVVQIAVALSWSVLFNSIQLYVQKRLFEHT